jgi:hypothetical protein
MNNSHELNKKDLRRGLSHAVYLMRLLRHNDDGAAGLAGIAGFAFGAVIAGHAGGTGRTG